MGMPPSLEEYETFIYSLPARYPAIRHALLSFIRLGPLTATVRAEIFFPLPPDLKHHRIPAPALNFARPNLPFLIQEIEQTLLSGT